MMLRRTSSSLFQAKVPRARFPKGRAPCLTAPWQGRRNLSMLQVGKLLQTRPKTRPKTRLKVRLKQRPEQLPKQPPKKLPKTPQQP